MTHLETLALRCLMPGFEGTSAPEWVRRRAAEGLGAVALYSRNVATRDQVAELTASLHRERPELLVAIDEEGGDVTRLEARSGSSYPGNLALGVAGDVALTQEVAAAIGADLAAAGVDLDLAPDADVNTNPRNPVIGVRSFGADPNLVAQHVAAWVTGLQSAGVAACAKHFPGHGDTSMDSHVELPTVNEDPHVRALEPFKAAIAAGVSAVMSAHILVPPIDSMPATLSRAIMTGLLRDELGFQGLAVTDGLEMRALTNARTLAENAVLALKAGCDLICIGGGLAGEDTVDDLSQAIVDAVNAGDLPRHRLDEAAARVDALAAERSRIGHPHSGTSNEVGLAAARRAVTREGAVRIADEAVVVRFRGPRSIAAGELPWGVADPLAARGVRVESIDVNGQAPDVEHIIDRAAGKSLVVAARDLHAHPADAAAVDAVLARRPDAVIVEMGWPGPRPSRARAYVATHGSARVNGVAAAEVLRP